MKCKKAADHIVRSNDEDGVAQGIYEFLDRMEKSIL